MSDPIQEARKSIADRDDKLADNLSLEPSTGFPGKSACVAQIGDNFVCWNCFELLGSGHTDMVMGQTIIRVCQSRECQKAVMEANAKRNKDGGAGSIITSGRRNDAGWPEE